MEDSGDSSGPASQRHYDVPIRSESDVIAWQNLWLLAAESAKADKSSYQEKLEHANGRDVFKYVFLINNAAVEQYVSQSRGQAEASFVLSRRVAIAGFALLIVAIGVGLFSELADRSLSVAYLSGIGGVLTEFIAGVFFWMYNRTLQQISIFYQGMMTQQHEALTAIGRSSELAVDRAKGPTTRPSGGN